MTLFAKTSGPFSASIAHDENRAFRMSHDRLGVRSNQIVRHRGSMGTHDDQIGTPLLASFNNSR